MQRKTPAEHANAAPSIGSWSATSCSKPKNNRTPIGHIAANAAFAIIRERRDHPDEAINVVIDIASSGLCSRIAKKIATPANQFVPPSDISLCTLAANAMPSINV